MSLYTFQGVVPPSASKHITIWPGGYAVEERGVGPREVTWQVVIAGVVVVSGMEGGSGQFTVNEISQAELVVKSAGEGGHFELEFRDQPVTEVSPPGQIVESAAPADSCFWKDLVLATQVCGGSGPQPTAHYDFGFTTYNNFDWVGAVPYTPTSGLATTPVAFMREVMIDGSPHIDFGVYPRTSYEWKFVIRDAFGVGLEEGSYTGNLYSPTNELLGTFALQRIGV